MKQLSVFLISIVLLLISTSCTKDSSLSGDENKPIPAPKAYESNHMFYSVGNATVFSETGTHLTELRWQDNDRYWNKVEYLISSCDITEYEMKPNHVLDEMTLKTPLYDEEGNPIRAADGSQLTLSVFRVKE